jgi:hypothetical protein
MVELLIKHGFDSRCIDIVGRTPLTIAEKKGFFDIANKIKVSRNFLRRGAKNFLESLFFKNKYKKRRLTRMLSKEREAILNLR